MEALSGPRDLARVRSALQAAGYKGEKIGFLSAVNFGTMARQVDVAADQFSRAGLNVEIIPVDFGVWLQRRANRRLVDKGGWSCTTTLLPGLDLWDPTSHLGLRGNGLQA